MFWTVVGIGATVVGTAVLVVTGGDPGTWVGAGSALGGVISMVIGALKLRRAPSVRRSR